MASACKANSGRWEEWEPSAEELSRAVSSAVAGDMAPLLRLALQLPRVTGSAIGKRSKRRDEIPEEDFVSKAAVYASTAVKTWPPKPGDFRRWWHLIVRSATGAVTRSEDVARRWLSCETQGWASEAYRQTAVSERPETPEEYAIRREEVSELLRRLDGETQSTRDVVIATQLEGEPVDEYARRVGRTPTAVHRQLGRWRKRWGVESRRAYSKRGANGEA